MPVSQQSDPWPKPVDGTFMLAVEDNHRGGIEAWEGWPFPYAPDWFLEDWEHTDIRPHIVRESDYAHVMVNTRAGFMPCGPGQLILRYSNGDLVISDVDGEDERAALQGMARKIIELSNSVLALAGSAARIDK